MTCVEDMNYNYCNIKLYVKINSKVTNALKVLELLNIDGSFFYLLRYITFLIDYLLFSSIYKKLHLKSYFYAIFGVQFKFFRSKNS